MTDRGEEIKNIGDAGDSMPNTSDVQEASDGPVCEMVKCLKLALHCGDHQSLKILLEKLETWKQQNDEEYNHNYWRVAQLIGETELKSLCILLKVTSNKAESVRWIYLQDVLSLFDMCLCNREIITNVLAFANSIQPVLAMALNQDCNEESCIKSLSIVNKLLVVCGMSFAKYMLPYPFLDALVQRIDCVSPKGSKLVKSVLYVAQSLLMCGHEWAYSYATQVLHNLSPTTDTEIYDNLINCVKSGKTPTECANDLINGRSKKDLLRVCLDQPWLYIYCSWPPCGVHNGIAQTFFRKCAACSVVRFCSRQCQSKHWETGHNVQCRALAKYNRCGELAL